MNKVYCVSCGNAVTDADDFCNKCGAHIDRAKGGPVGKPEPRPQPIQQPRVVTHEFKPLPYENIGFFKVYSYGYTYSNLLYLMLLMPIGIILFTYTVTCFSTFAGLIPIFIGIFLLFFFLLSLPFITRAFGWLGELMVGVKLAPKQQKVAEQVENDTMWKKGFRKLGDKNIWYSFFYYLIIVMPFGIFTFTLVVSLIPTALGLMFSWISLIFQYTGVGVNWMALTGLPLGFWIFVYIITPVIGFFLLTASLHLFNKLAIIHAKLIAKIAI